MTADIQPWGRVWGVAIRTSVGNAYSARARRLSQMRGKESVTPMPFNRTPQQ